MRVIFRFIGNADSYVCFFYKDPSVSDLLYVSRQVTSNRKLAGVSPYVLSLT